MADNSWVTVDMVGDDSPVLPRRGRVQSADSGGVGDSPNVTSRRGGLRLSQNLGSTPARQLMGEGPHSSTPSSDTDVINNLADMVGQLGAQIGESIVDRLISARVVNTSSAPQNASTNQTQGLPSNSNSYETPHVTVHVKSDREPQIFSGDCDKYSVQEWIELTKTYLRRHAVPVHEQGDEILCRLRGKARDVVRVALRSDSSLDVIQHPELIYNVLLQYFDDASSCLPMADFYATFPRHRENPVDYWIRLNNAADLAVAGLRRQGKQAENMNDEVALMFVKHCPDQELSSILKCKPMHEWTARDVQKRIDDYQREVRASGRSSGAVQMKCHAAAITSEQFGSHGPEQYSASGSSLPSLPSQCQGYHPPPQPASVSNSVQSQDCCAPCPATVPIVAQNLQQSEERLLSRMVDMFQQMMERMQQRNTAVPARGGRSQRAPGERRARETACRVCNDSSHTTVSHCMSDRLCFSCLAPGHTKANCQANTQSSQPQPGGN